MAADPLVGKILADRFEILSRIGEGGTGVVYKAKQIAVDREIAIKILGAHVSSDPQWVRRFQNEGKASAKLSSPNTVRFIDSGQTNDGLFFIAMELLQGISLRDEIDKVGRMSPQRALRIMAQACNSIGEANAAGIIHRDLKPDNLFLHNAKGPGDFVKVLDFGVAKVDSPNNANATSVGMALGTPAYMSPEQARGAKLGPESDLYALGIVLYEMISGKPPFDSKIPTEVVIAHIRDPPPPLNGVPEPLVKLIMKALEKDPKKRFSSGEQMGEACQAVLQELHPDLTPSGVRTASPITGQGQAPKSAPGPSTTRPSQARPEAAQRTMLGDAPQLSGAGGAPPAPASWSSGTDAKQNGPNGTLILPDSSGVIAFAMEEIKQVRAHALDDTVKPLVPAPMTFWAAWIFLGTGFALAFHFFHLHSQIVG